MGKRAADAVAAVGILGGVSVAAWLMWRGPSRPMGDGAPPPDDAPAARAPLDWTEMYLKQDTPVCPTREAMRRLVQLTVDKAAFARHYREAGCTTWPGDGSTVGLVQTDWGYCEIAHQGRTAWTQCEILGKR